MGCAIYLPCKSRDPPGDRQRHVPDSFINAMRRFISLRGTVSQLCSDMGTNFVGASRELSEALKEIDCERVREYLVRNGCEFVFNPPHASHMGGVWEHQIRTVRNILSALLKDHGSQLDDEGLRTLMAEASAIVNSRPLTVETLHDPLSSAPLTPNHLLMMKPSVMVPPPGEFQAADVYCCKRWRRVQYLANLFWTRWKKEYLQQLQTRQKWCNPKRDLKEGDIVLMDDPSLPRCQWRLGRITKAYPSKDKSIRKVQVAVGDPLLDKRGRHTRPITHLDRPVHKLVLLHESLE